MLPVLTGEASPPGSEPAGACCEACAVAPAAAHADVPAQTSPEVIGATPTRAVDARSSPPESASLRVPLPVLGPSGRPGIGISRSADRRITFAGLAAAAVFLALAAASILLPPAIRLGTWLPVHLALAGAAATAIAAVLPFFTTALVVARPVRPAIRIGGIALVAFGALSVMTVYGHALGQVVPATLAGGSFLAGIVLVGVAALAPLRGALGPRRMILERAYALALANVLVGATIATLVVGGNLTVGGAWGGLKPAHAWLNLVGFAGLVIVATLAHLAPTVVGTRLRPRASSRLAIVGIAVGAPLIATGYATGLDVVARAGAAAVLGGALGIAAHGFVINLDPDRGRWTTEFGWHRAAAWALLAGQAWIGLGLAVAAARVLVLGAQPAAWSLTILLGPLVIGGVIQILIGAMTHLLPAIGPGDPIRHAGQRRLLGSAATVRIGILNAGAALVTLGFGPMADVAIGAGAAGAGGSTGVAGSGLVGLGLACAAIGVGATLALLLAAAWKARA
jgi:nitrite reductase (NO-forming)